MKRRNQTFSCPTCGEDVPARAKACPHCGADEETGWSEDAEYDDLDLPSNDPDDDFDPLASDGKPARWVLVTIVVVVVVIAFLAILGR